MKKLLLTLSASLCTLCCALGLTACDFGGNKNPSQPLTFALNDDGESYSVSFNMHYIPSEAIDIVIPDTYLNKPVTRIAESAFAIGFSSVADFPLTVTIPESVTVIGAAAFAGCDTLTSVNIPSRVTTIEDRTFSSCEKLTSINIPNGVTSIGEGAFSECFGMKSVTIGRGVKSIGQEAFYRTGLTSVDIPDSVESLGDGAFAFCGSLKNLKVGSGIRSVGDGSNSGLGSAFSESAIETAEIPAIAAVALRNNSFLKSVVITSGDEIGLGALSGCPNLKSVKIADSVTVIGEYAFGESPIETAELPASACTSNIAKNNTHLKTAVITSGSEINEGSFNGCTHLNSITIPSSVTEIKANTFDGCVNISDIIYTGDVASWCGIKGLSDIMQNSNKSITIGGKKIVGTLAIPEGVTSIRDHAFAYCGDIDSIILPKNTSVAKDSFRGCNISILYYMGTGQEWNASVINSSALINARRYCYSEDEPELDPSGSGYIGFYWRYAADGTTPVIWA